MRRAMMLVGMALLLACMAAGVAAAAERFNGKDGHDVLDANNFNKDRDRLFGGDVGDKLLANDGDGRDVVKGGAGRDVCYVDPGDRTVNCNVVRDEARVGDDAPKDLEFLK